MNGPRILLIVGGGIAAYKACELVRAVRKAGGEVTCVLTEAGAQFVTPMALAALSENPVYTTLWDLKNESEMGHIQLSREADLVVVCPATANLLAKMASGIADDLATTLLLATDKPVVAIPAMNVRMWQHESTQRNVETLRAAGVDIMDPDEGEMACGEFGPGRLPDPPAVWGRIAWALGIDPGDIASLPGQQPMRELPQPAPTEAEAETTEEAIAGDAAPTAEAPADEAPSEAAGEEGAAEAAGEEDLEYLPDDAFALPDPEPDEGEQTVGGELGGLSSSLISRGLKKAKQAISFTGLTSADEASQTEEVPPPADAGGMLLSKKGEARSAPPTDPAAINHLVSGHEDGAPQPFEGEVIPGNEGLDFGNQAPPEGEAPDAFDEDAETPPAEPPEPEIEPGPRPLDGKHVLVTAGPTWEPIDPVRYIANRSSGKQGFAIAAAAAAAGAKVTLVSGPVNLDTPPGVDRVDVETAVEMADAVKKALPADIAVMVAAVADWRTVDVSPQKLKKRGSAPPALLLTENPDILTTVAAMSERPKLLIGFAAETDDVLKNAKDKRKRKGADWIVANDVSADVMGGEDNTVHIVTGKEVESLPEMPKEEVAKILVERFADALAK